MKQCTKCRLELNEDFFEMQQKRGRRRSVCKTCRRIEQKEWYAKRKANIEHLKKPEQKTCSDCKQVKPITDFSPASPGYFQGRCKVCKNNQVRIQRERQRVKDNRTWYQAYVNEQGAVVKGCSSCHEIKPIVDFYTSRTRVHSACKECDRELRKKIYHTDPEKYRAQAREYARQHPEEIKRRFDRWRSANRLHLARYKTMQSRLHHKKVNAQRRQRYNDMTPEQRHAQYLQRQAGALDWRERNKAYRRMTNRQWRLNNPAKHAEKESRRRARKNNAPIIERIDREAIIERDKWTCYLCGTVCTSINVSLDHVVPLFHGGPHTAGNLRVACRSCNSKKGPKFLQDFLTRLPK